MSVDGDTVDLTEEEKGSGKPQRNGHQQRLRLQDFEVDSSSSSSSSSSKAASVVARCAFSF